ncbi:glycosyltransferase family 4 protein [Rubellimicrobium aerolatum]|uniref:Glycosyltransferase family 4 protein n=1 Tax=Rubellimicrobium aerolatum TaxID=490979 RepID=A0ABW0S9G2_9RHOB|nr:glycosyltransferase family 4 protein [Rubellimicrobium aerolatum]MBP1804938.1 glycosyltransferase involved in cell wall biosynthesis [Rubellimicrobium aerolatum]
MADATSRHVLIVVENLPVPLDRRVWLEATTLIAAGYRVSVICPQMRNWTAPYEEIDGVHIYRYPLPLEAHEGAVAYAREYGAAVKGWFNLAARVWKEQGPFQVIQGCNPPDLVFLLARRYRSKGVAYLFDHHDPSPELFEAKFGRKGMLYNVMLLWEKLTFRTARVSIATNESFRRIAIERGGMDPDDVFVVRSAPKLETFIPGPGNLVHRNDAGTVLGYVGVIGQQEGMDLLVAAADHLVNGLGRSDVHFAIVGFGSGLDEMKADVARRELTDKFTFHGPLYGEALVEVLNSIDIGVAPDPRNAMNDICTMNKVIEYMALGKPVVQFDLTEGRASAGEASLYARANEPEDFADKIAVLMDDPDLRERLGQIGLDRVRGGLSWSHSAPRLLAAYDRIYRTLG